MCVCVCIQYIHKDPLYETDKYASIKQYGKEQKRFIHENQLRSMSDQ